MKEVNFIIRMSCNDLEQARKYYLEQGFSILCAEEENHALWVSKSGLTLCVIESCDDSPALVGYWQKPDEAIKNLESLGIIFNFSADASGNHFEAVFTDPGGTPVIIADADDLPVEVKIDVNCLKEFSIPSTNSFQDSINFWHNLGFEIQPGEAQPHPWAVLKRANISLGIHQNENWREAGLCFDKKNNPFSGEAILMDIKVYNTLNISQTKDGCRIYQLG
jgi:hypothetical protein